MEGIPHTSEQREKVPDWRILKERAHDEAEKQIDSIDGFSELPSQEQIALLEHLIETLAEGGNQNRFIAEEVARKKEHLVEIDRHTKRLLELGVST